MTVRADDAATVATTVATTSTPTFSTPQPPALEDLFQSLPPTTQQAPLVTPATPLPLHHLPGPISMLASQEALWTSISKLDRVLQGSRRQHTTLNHTQVPCLTSTHALYSSDTQCSQRSSVN